MTITARPPRFVVTGTDTGIGKTVFAAALTAALGASYWKPVQAGTADEIDASVVQRLGQIPASRIVPSAYTLAMPASPHIAAAAEGIDIRQRNLGLPDVVGPLVIEGAGGVMVPLSLRLLQIDLFAFWSLPVIVCARTALGTINHTLLTLEAMRRRRVHVTGIAFIGAPEPDVETTITTLGRTSSLGRLPLIEPLTAEGLATAFASAFDPAAFPV